MKTLRELGTKESLLNLIMNIYLKNPTTIFTINGET